MKKLCNLVILCGLLLLAACSQTPQPVQDKQDISQLATINITASDKQADIEQKYGAKAIVFRPEASFAVLGFSQGQLTALSTEPNAPITSPEVSASGKGAWGGGKGAWGGGNKAWGGGWKAWGGGNKAWGGGINAWAGGHLSLPTLPSENRALWTQIRLPQAHALSVNFGLGAKVAVIDTGIDPSHPMFEGQLAPATQWKDFVDGDDNPQEVAGSFYGHGTAVAGIILQVAPKATILPLRVLDGDGIGDTDNVILAIDWAIQQGANIINLSLGTDVDVASLQSMISYANSLGVFVVASAGNTGSSMTYPAANAALAPNGEKFLSVGSIDATGVRSEFSSYGSGLKFMAPGEQVYSAYPDNQFAYFNGTSFASPVVAGLVALAFKDTVYTEEVHYYLGKSSKWSDTGSIRPLAQIVPSVLDRAWTTQKQGVGNG